MLLRAWFARPEAQAPDWYRASSDPVVGRALRLLHHNPAHQVGYGSSFALSTAFKRIRGVSPQQHRAAAPTGARVGQAG